MKSAQPNGSRQTWHPLVGEHVSIRRIRALVERLANVDTTVLITGESGTGKEVVARAIHELSPRCNRLFVPVNCAAIPYEMLESEMFGHERGAFTGASSAREGLFCLADGGTIFLDEIGDMPPQLQAKLLRAIEDRMVRALGSDRPTKVNVRIIAASNRDLGSAVKGGTFRADLFYRLQVMPLAIPPLRERRSDIPLLVEHFLERWRKRFPTRNLTVDQEAMVRLWDYDWPGNVRELENLIERLAVLCDDCGIDVSLLPRNILPRVDEGNLLEPEGEFSADFVKLVRRFEGRLINIALCRAKGNKQAAARLLGLKRTTFTAKLQKYGVFSD